MAKTNVLHEWFPTAKWPLVISAPMFTVANGALAAEVTRAGGLGMVPAGMDPSTESPHLAALDSQLTIAHQILAKKTESSSADDESRPPLPIGVGFLTLLATPDAYRANVLPILRKHRPAFVWLFGSDPSEYGPLIALFHDECAEFCGGLKVFVQVGTVEAARQAARAGADVVVAQGSDAGGHQWAQAASVMTLVPEIVDALRNEAEFKSGKEVAVVAAGGIVDGRGWRRHWRWARMRLLWAPGTSDGGATTTRLGAEWITIRSSANDAIMGYPTWSKLYAGRTTLHSGLTDIANGVPVEQVHESFKKGLTEGDETRMFTFAGTGVGLVQKSQSAGEVVQEVRTEALDVIANLKGNL
ncbi:uncharacterized protein PG998_003870 [Apiospora kogelbergensis]|uniref:uncharacterized protein n=1 Tax=Apiospora kogelbergensis TaxID=1337665 RepID=UPI00312DC15E